MVRMIQSEHLKLKRTSARKMIIWIPLIPLILATILTTGSMQGGSFNWMYVLFFPLTVGLICSVANKNEEKATKHYSILTHDISRRKVFIAKVIVLCGYLAISYLFFILVMELLVQIMLGLNVAQEYRLSFIKMITASFFLWLSSIWQVPLGLWIAKKMSYIMPVVISVVLTTVGVIFTASSSLWFIFPWGWPVRLAIPLTGVLPNGLPAEVGDVLLNTNVIGFGGLLSVLLFCLATFVLSNQFLKKELAE